MSICYEAKSGKVGAGTYFLEWNWGTIYLINIEYYPMINWERLFKEKTNWVKILTYGHFEGNSMEDVRFVPEAKFTQLKNGLNIIEYPPGTKIEPLIIGIDKSNEEFGISQRFIWNGSSDVLKSCSCGGKIDTHKPECPENKTEELNDLSGFYYQDQSPKRYLGMPEPKKCECGSESVGSPKHSNYCPKYEVE